MHPENDCIISTMMMRHILLISKTLSATYYCLFGAEPFHINKMETGVFSLALITVPLKACTSIKGPLVYKIDILLDFREQLLC